MMNILALLENLNEDLSKTDIHRLHQISQAILTMTGRVTMLNISRWTGKGGSYRTVQRFFNSTISWIDVFLKFFFQHLFRSTHEYLLVGDESVITKSGKETYGLNHFFSGLLNKITKGIAVFALSLVSVEEGISYPMQVKQVIRPAEKKKPAKKKSKKDKKKKLTKKRGRPKGSKNRDKTQVELTAELLGIQKMVEKQLATLKNRVHIRHLALDGHFGNNNALQMVRQCDLHLVSKLRYDSALYFLYDGIQKNKGPRKRYGQKIDYRNIPEKYLVEKSLDGDIETRIYQAKMLHKSFAQALNVVIFIKTNIKTGSFANAILFSSDLKLSYEKIIRYYSLRFQIEFNFRDAKQFWGLEDFMNVKKLPLTNALNLSFFMVNLSQVLLREFKQTHPQSGIIDLKAYFRAAKYFEETIKMLPQKPDTILLEQIFGHITAIGSIHSHKIALSSP